MKNCIWILVIASSAQLTTAIDFVEDSPIEDGELIFAHVVSFNCFFYLLVPVLKILYLF